MDHNIHPGALDYPPSSGMYEGDSLSDSDWLDIASNRESDDNDSVMSGDSDTEDMGLPLSRRSSVSLGSSRDGEVEAWEGLIDESGDEEIQGGVETGIAMPPTGAVAESTITDASETIIGVTHNILEDQRVNEALDQSMISTLSASRSSTTSTLASLRDLRLSFPDPLTSSRDELNRSFEDVSTSDADVTLDTDITTDDLNAYDDCIDNANLLLREENLGSFIPCSVDTKQASDIDNVAFEVVLYGSPSPSIKWAFVSDLMEKAVSAAGHSLVQVVPHTDQATRYLHYWYKDDDSVKGTPSVVHVIPVHDRTDNYKAIDMPSIHISGKRPSLAIVYLPSAIYMPTADHTLYLPVLVPSASPIENDMSREIAARDWDTLSIPLDKVAHLDLESKSPIFNGSQALCIQDMHAHRLLQRLLFTSKKRPSRTFSDHISPAQAVTLFALVSLIVGFTMNTAFHKSTTPTPTITTITNTMASISSVSILTGIFTPEVNHTSAIATTAKTDAPVMSTHKEFSLSIFNPGSTSLVITPSSGFPVTGSSATPNIAGSHCRPVTWTDKVKSAKDIIVQPVIHLAAEAGPSTTTVSQFDQDGAFISATKTTALSLVVESLSDVLDGPVTRIRNDLRVDEVLESLDELARAIRRQTIHRVNTSKGKAKEIRDSIHHRHERARGRAKQLKKKGEKIIYLASAEFIEKTNMAKQKARDITASLTQSESWRAYQKVHADWVAALKEKVREGEGCFRTGNANCPGRSKSSGPSSLFSRSLADFYMA